MLHHGQRRNGNECCGAYGHELTWDEMNWLAKWCFVRGVNLLYPHAFYYSVRGPRREERPPDVGPNSPWWRRYREYADSCRRLSWLNTDSEHVCHVAILGSDNRLPWRAARICFEHQHDFNYLPASELNGSVRVEADGLHIAEMTYAALVVEEESFTAGLPQLREMDRMGRLVRYSSTGGLVAELDRLTPRTVQVQSATPGLRARHICKQRCHAFILFNEGREPVDVGIDFPVSGASWSLDAVTGALATRRPGQTLQLVGHGMEIVLVGMG
jgi:hypothetical protein